MLQILQMSSGIKTRIPVDPIPLYQDQLLVLKPKAPTQINRIKILFQLKKDEDVLVNRYKSHDLILNKAVLLFKLILFLFISID